MQQQETPTPRFKVSRNAMGIPSIIDSAKKGKGNKGVVALFFKDKDYAQRAELYASVCAAALNEEADRRARKG